MTGHLFDTTEMVLDLVERGATLDEAKAHVQHAVDAVMQSIMDDLATQRSRPLPSRRDQSAYAEYLITGHYPLSADIGARCMEAQEVGP